MAQQFPPCDISKESSWLDKRYSCLKKRTRCFVGTEAEGPHRGTEPVLFIPGSVDQDVLIKAFTGRKYERIYYGAGNDRDISRERLISIVGMCGLAGIENIDVECDLEAHLWLSRHDGYIEVASPLSPTPKIIITVINTNPSYFNSARYFKYVSSIQNEIVWIDTKFMRVYRTTLDDPLFDADQEI